MPLHHYLPATFLSNFSLDENTIPRRKRKIFVGDKKSKNIFPVSCENAGAINNLYTRLYYKKDPEFIEKIWGNYETKLHIAIPRLITGDLDAKTWIRFLVPFVACMLVRGPDFNVRFKNRIESLLGEEMSINYLGKINIDGARFLELQRLLFPVTAAKWIVIHAPGNEQLMTNDLGYCPFLHPKSLDYGLAIPLGKNFVLAISPRKRGQILKKLGEKWRPIIQYTTNRCDNNHDLNRSIVSMAQRFIFSPNDELVDKYLKESNNLSRPIEPEMMGFVDGYHSRAYEFTWHRLAIFLENETTSEKGEFPLNWKYLFNGWYPPVIFPTNLIGFPPPLKINKYSISFNFYNPDDYYKLNRIINFEEMGLFKESINEARSGYKFTSNNELKNEFQFAIANGLYKLGRKDRASQILDDLLKKQPNHSRARLNRAANSLEDNNLEKAFSDLNFIIGNDPDFIEARINLVTYYLKIDEVNNAIYEATIACNQAPEGNILGLSLLAKGIAHYANKQIEEAFTDVSTALLHLKSKENLGIGYFYRAQIGLQEPDKELNKVSRNEMAKSSDGSHSKQNEILYKDYNAQNAIDDLTESIHFLPESSKLLIDVLDMRGRLYQLINKQDLALEDYLRAGKIDETNPSSSSGKVKF
jgi:tetratricopeptide (TPR) repeat protein